MILVRLSGLFLVALGLAGAYVFPAKFGWLVWPAAALLCLGFTNYLAGGRGFIDQIFWFTPSFCATAEWLIMTGWLGIFRNEFLKPMSGQSLMTVVVLTGLAALFLFLDPQSRDFSQHKEGG